FELQSKLEIEKKELNDALRKASQEVEDRDAKIAKLSHYKVDLDEEIRVAQERNESLLQKMKGFEKIVEAERRDFRATTHKLQGQVDTLKQQIELEKGSVESRQKINAGQTAELEKLSSIIAELEKAKAALEREKRTMARENDRDKQTITDNERERADLKKQLNKQNDEVQRLRKLLYG
ncbi:MAG: hypothetical protein Q8P67_07650, partial [archaeon]|nr:hypothetical protein [archaeon]